MKTPQETFDLYVAHIGSALAAQGVWATKEAFAETTCALAAALITERNKYTKDNAGGFHIHSPKEEKPDEK